MDFDVEPSLRAFRQRPGSNSASTNRERDKSRAQSKIVRWIRLFRRKRAFVAAVKASLFQGNSNLALLRDVEMVKTIHGMNTSDPEFKSLVRTLCLRALALWDFASDPSTPLNPFLDIGNAKRTSAALLFLVPLALSTALSPDFAHGPEIQVAILFADSKFFGRDSSASEELLKPTIIEMKRVLDEGLAKSVITRTTPYISSISNSEAHERKTQAPRLVGLWLTSMVAITRVVSTPSEIPRRLLSIPIIVPFLEATGISLLMEAMQGTLLLKPSACIDLVDSLQIPGEGILYLLGNLCSLLKSANSASIADLVAFFSTALQHLSTFMDVGSTHQTNKNFHPILGWYHGSSWNLPRSFQDAILTQLEHLWTKRTCSLMFRPLLDFDALLLQAVDIKSPRATRSAKRQPNQDLTLLSVDVCQTCRLYTQLASLLITRTHSILVSISFTPKLVSALWYLLWHTTSEFKLFLKSAASKAVWEKEFYGPTLEVACEGLRLLFLTVDEQDLKDSHPFPLLFIQKISKFLNKLAYLHILNKIDCSHVIKLLRLLHDRNIFSTSDDWVLKECKSKSFLDSLATYTDSSVKILQTIPWALSFSHRVEIFVSLLKRDAHQATTHVKLRIHRKTILQDGFRILKSLSPSQFKLRFVVEFVNEFGLSESGIDHAGLCKEFLSLFISSILSPDYGLFTASPLKDGSVLPSSLNQLRLVFGGEAVWSEAFSVVGCVIAKTLLMGIRIDLPFPVFFYRKLCGDANDFEDLTTLDPVLHKNLTFLKHYEGDVADLGLTFSLTEDDGELFTHDPNSTSAADPSPTLRKQLLQLVPNGDSIAVTNTSKHEYIYLMANHKLNTQYKTQVHHLISSLKRIVPHSHLRMFTPTELQFLSSGFSVDHKGWDVEDLKANVKYDGYTSFDSSIRLFWKVVEGFSNEERGRLLKFVTSCSQPPIGGFKAMDPPFTIRYVAPTSQSTASTSSSTTPIHTITSTLKSLWSIVGGPSISPERLPTAATCFNLLKLPPYKNERELKDKLKMAIRVDGFELS